MTSEITSPAANVELVRAGFQAFNAGDTDECMTHMVPDIVINLAELPEPQHGREVWRQGFEMMKRAFPRPAGPHRGHLRCPGQGRRPAAVPRHPLRRVPGLHPTGRTIEYVSHEFYRIADGLIAEEWICSDMATLLGQLS
jgi:hypothetical protein